MHQRCGHGACCWIATVNTKAVPQVYQPTASAIEHSSLNPGFCVMVLIAGRDVYEESPCVWHNTNGRWTIVSPDGTVTEVPVNQPSRGVVGCLWRVIVPESG